MSQEWTQEWASAIREQGHYGIEGLLIEETFYILFVFPGRELDPIERRVLNSIQSGIQLLQLRQQKCGRIESLRLQLQRRLTIGLMLKERLGNWEGRMVNREGRIEEY